MKVKGTTFKNQDQAMQVGNRQLTNQSTNQPTEQLTNQLTKPANQPTNQPADQSTDQTIHPTTLPTIQPTNQLANQQPTIQRPDHPLNHSDNRPTIQPSLSCAGHHSASPPPPEPDQHARGWVAPPSPGPRVGPSRLPRQPTQTQEHTESWPAAQDSQSGMYIPMVNNTQDTSKFDMSDKKSP